MKRLLLQKGSVILCFLLFFIIIEAITFRWVNFTFLPKFLIIDFMLALGLASVIFLIKSLKLSLAYLSLVFTFILSLFLINATMYGVNFDLFTLQQLQLLDEAQAVFNFDFLSIPSIITGTIVLLVFIAVNIVLITIIKKRPKITNYYRNALVAFAFIALVLVGYFTSETPLMKRYNEIENITAFKRANLESYGLLGYYFKESQNIIALSHFIDDSEPEPTATIPIEPLVTTEPKVPIETTKSTKTTGPLLVFEKSPFFGLLEGKNIITIMLESGQSFAVNEHLTPNLYRLTREGLYFANNYSENKTNQSEMIAIAGNYPSVNFSPSLYDYDFSFSLAELLNDTYNTSYFHDNEPSFYGRGDLMPMLGFENCYFHDEINPDLPLPKWDGDYTLDSITLDQILPLLIDTDRPFYSFWTSFSSHGPYNYGPENQVLFEELGYFDLIDQAKEDGTWFNILYDSTELNQLRIRHYQAAIMDFDVALGKILASLEENHLIEDTIIVIYGDHNVYYHELALAIFDTTAEEYYRSEMYETFMCIYNPLLTKTYLDYFETESTSITKFTSPYVIVPTLLDLLGIPFNEDKYLGDSVFLESEQIFYSHKLSSIFTDALFSNDGYEIIYDPYSADDQAIEAFRLQAMKVMDRLNKVNSLYLSSKKNKTGK
ncbi:MAG: LTA synthase family protein [Candidatus Izemoplasmatales bacterium]|jgi:phosphoglycerol transferase MdoB-like AlkP superfamily enzyme